MYKQRETTYVKVWLFETLCDIFDSSYRNFLKLSTKSRNDASILSHLVYGFASSKFRTYLANVGYQF
jgi:hypothetical protein